MVFLRYELRTQIVLYSVQHCSYCRPKISDPRCSFGKWQNPVLQRVHRVPHSLQHGAPRGYSTMLQIISSDRKILGKTSSELLFWSIVATLKIHDKPGTTASVAGRMIQYSTVRNLSPELKRRYCTTPQESLVGLLRCSAIQSNPIQNGGG